MDEVNQKAPLGGLARKLIQVGLLNQEMAFSITELSIKQKMPFVSALVEGHYIDSEVLATACSQEFGIPLLDLNAFQTQHMPVDIINQDLIVQYHALPIFRRGDRLYVAISDPTNLKAVDEIKYQTNTNTEAILVSEYKFRALIQKVLSTSSEKLLGSLEGLDLDSIDILNRDDAEKSSKTMLGTDVEDAPIVRFINKVILDAVNLGASDLHFEPYETTYRIRFRRDGILYPNATLPVGIANRFSARLKVMARLDISERRVPQDGRLKMRISTNRTIDFRVSTCPTLFGEKVVVRILDPSSAKLGIDALGYESAQKELFMKAIHKPQGMILVTGPTGSGKTISLYTALNILNTNEVNISTCEDPVEINLSGINQVNVNVKAGLTFSAALRAFLRQDPDVIMIGEIRDLETAEIAVKAAQTGHMVLSTLHTNSAADTLTRMINMGVPAYNLATSVTLVVAQRLARLLCQYCKTRALIPESALLQLGFLAAELSSLEIFEAKGCDKCKNGYQGRIGIYETLYVTPEISRIIMAGGNAIDLYTAAIKAGMWDLRKSGLNKVKQGLTSLEELSRITKD